MPRICILTPDVAGPHQGDDCVAACAAIARVWAAAGHDVTLLQGGGREGEPSTGGAERLAAAGIRCVPCPPSGLAIHPGGPVQASFDAYRWLRAQPRFDLVYAPERSGVGFHALMARRLGLAFAGTRFVVGTRSPTLWHRDGGRELVDGIPDLTADYMERTSVAEADAAVSPSRYMLDWMRSAGWQLPARIEVLPDPMERRPHGGAGTEASPVRELVFLGRLEPRAGVFVVLEALRALGAEGDGLEVTLLGGAGSGDVDVRAAIEARRPGNIRSWRLLTTLGTEETLAYLAGPGRLTIMAPLAANAPRMVVECLARGIPFLASAVGGIPELVAPEDHGRTLFQPVPGCLADAIGRTLREGATAPRAAADPGTVEDGWRAVAMAPAPQRPAREIARPLVSVCVTHRDRPAKLRLALDALRRQTYVPFEVVLVDDGSVTEAAKAMLDALEAEFAPLGWRVIRQRNAYLGHARNTAWRAARGEWVLFHDDDNLAFPTQLEVLVRAAQHGGADILTGSMALFTGEGPPPAPDLAGTPPAGLQVFAPLGAALSAGMLLNLFGDAHALTHRRVLEALGGFTEDYGVGHEDWEFHARAVLAGFTLLALPEPLFWYRLSPGSMLRTTAWREADLRRSARPYLAAVPPYVAPVLLHALRLTHQAAAQRPAEEAPAPPPALQRLRALYARALRVPVAGAVVAAVWRGGRAAVRRLRH